MSEIAAKMEVLDPAASALENYKESLRAILRHLGIAQFMMRGGTIRVILCGMELLRIKEAIGRKPGRPEIEDTAPRFTQLVEEAGIKRSQAYLYIKIATEAKRRLKLPAETKALFGTPLAQLEEAQIEALIHHVSKATTSETLSELLVEFGIGVGPMGGTINENRNHERKPPGMREDPRIEAWETVGLRIRGMTEVCHDEVFKSMVHVLPLDDDEENNRLGLLTMRRLVSSTNELLNEAIRARKADLAAAGTPFLLDELNNGEGGLNA